MTAIGEAWALHPLVSVGGAGAHGRIADGSGRKGAS
jgi:hypothetical protein